MSGTSGTQPGGQTMEGTGGELENNEKIGRRGSRSKYCGRPGKRQRRNTAIPIVVKWWFCVSDGIAAVL